ncbi:MAG: chlorohydrolase [Myxococcales bacterium]|nr:chlorohydrolase [Myxococcales bacterium]
MALTIRGGRVFHGDPVIERFGELVLDAGVVSAGEPRVGLEHAEILEAEGCIVLPGFVIAHHHLYSALARGMPGPRVPPRSFVEVLERVWWRLDRALDADLVEQSALAGTLEALMCGVTGIVDHHASPSFIDTSLDCIARGVERAGGRAVVCYEATDRHGDEGFAMGLAENARMLACVRDGTAGARLRAMVGGHAPFTLSDTHLEELARLAAKHDVAVHLHVAEDVHDQLDARARGASHVTERLVRAGVLSGRALIAHGVHLSEAELELLMASRATLTHQPRSNMNNHVGYLGHARIMANRVALGTDGINGDIFDEAHAAFFRLREHDAAGAAETVWSWLAGGWRVLSRAFGLEPERGFGWLYPGCPADVIVLDYDSATPIHADSLPWHLAFGMSARNVRDVVVGGEVVVRDREPVKLRRAETLRESRSAAERLWARMAELE